MPSTDLILIDRPDLAEWLVRHGQYYIAGLNNYDVFGLEADPTRDEFILRGVLMLSGSGHRATVRLTAIGRRLYMRLRKEAALT